MEMLVSSLNEIKSTELIVCRYSCCVGNEIVFLADPSDRINHKVVCPKCKKVHEIDMKPVFMVGLGDSDWDSSAKTLKSMKDDEILKEVQKIDIKFKVV